MGFESTAAERSSENSLDTNQQGPPPSYDAVVAMDNAGTAQHPKCKKRAIINRCSMYDPSDIKRHHYHHEMAGGGGDIEEMDSKCDVSGTSDDESAPSAAVTSTRPKSINNEQILNVTDINRRAVIRRQSNCCCEHLAIDRPYDIVKLCKLCGREIQSINSESGSYRKLNIQYCNCYELPAPKVECGDSAAAGDDDDVDKCNNNCALTRCASSDVNDNMPSTSSHYCEGSTSNSNGLDRNCDNCQNNNIDNSYDDSRDADKKCATNSVVNFETLNENGLIRLDMSQIIDRTGLPTYEAALKLESSGYV